MGHTQDKVSQFANCKYSRIHNHHFHFQTLVINFETHLVLHSIYQTQITPLTFTSKPNSLLFPNKFSHLKKNILTLLEPNFCG